MTFTWTSSIDGQLLQGLESEFTANGMTSPLVSLSDGIHDITLEICDDKGNCVEETRSIELSNQPPVIIVTTDPELSPWGELISPITKPIGFSLNGTTDPEGDTLTCSWNWLGKSQEISDCTNGTGNLLFANETITNFDLTLIVSDGINTPSEWVIPVELFNEMPNASFDIIRMGNFSEDMISLVSTTVDPEGDEITYLWESSLDGIISNERLMARLPFSRKPCD